MNRPETILMDAIEDGDGLGVWLKSQPPEFACAIAARVLRSGFTRRNVLTPGPASCGLRRPLFAICGRSYAAINTGTE